MENQDNKDIELIDLITSLIRQKKLITIGTILLVVIFTLTTINRTEKKSYTFKVETNELPQKIRNMIFLENQSICKLYEQQLSDISNIQYVNDKYLLFNKSNLENILKTNQFLVEKSTLNNYVSIKIVTFETDISKVKNFILDLKNTADSTITNTINKKIKNLENIIKFTLDSLNKNVAMSETYSYVELKLADSEIKNYLNIRNEFSSLNENVYVSDTSTSIVVYILIFLISEILLLIFAYAIDYIVINKVEIKNKLHPNT